MTAYPSDVETDCSLLLDASEESAYVYGFSIQFSLFF